MNPLGIHQGSFRDASIVHDSIQKTRWARRLAQRKERERLIGFDYAALIAYNGTAFSGYARQPNRPSVEGTLRQVLEPQVRGFKRMAVAGRTDRGVSALAQVVSFRSEEPQDTERLQQQINQACPEALWCRQLLRAPHGFHAQFWATHRRYRYFYPYSEELESKIPKINEQLQNLLGTRCMYAFSRETPEGQNTVRTLTHAKAFFAYFDTRPAICFEIEAHGFLRQMVRVLVGTAVVHGLASETDHTLAEIARSQRRDLTADPAPPEPLIFAGVRYIDWCPG